MNYQSGQTKQPTLADTSFEGCIVMLRVDTHVTVDCSADIKHQDIIMNKRATNNNNTGRSVNLL